TVDIHCGGVDLIFPHHENEIAQSEAATGTQFVRLWSHGAFLQIDEEKMSKRLGNFLTLEEVLESTDGARPSTVRYLLAATAHYRKMLNYSTESLDAARGAVERLVVFRDRLDEAAPGRGGAEAAVELARRARAEFDAALDDDLNLPEAMGHVFAAVRDANRLLDEDRVDASGREALLGLVEHVDDVLGILPLVDREREESLSDPERRLLEARIAARTARDWATSDRIRSELAGRGIIIE